MSGQAYIMAVPAFLAISGFLVLKSYEESGSWSVFIQKRALRILPALLVSLVLVWALLDKNAVGVSVMIWLFGGLWTPYGPGNQPLWSLAWEELAYLCLAVLWTVGAYRKPAVIWMLLVLSLVIVFLGRHASPHNQIILYLMPSFLIGNLAYLYRETLRRVHPAVPWALLLVVIFRRDIPYAASVHHVSPVVFQAFAVVWAGMAGWRAIPFRFPDISYSLYIFHWPVMAWLLNSGWVSTPFQMAVFAPAFLLPVCLASWFLVGKPALRLKPASRKVDAAGLA